MRAALAAATQFGGGTDLAYEFLTTGIPPLPAPGAAGAAGHAGPAPTGGPLAALRSHPQFNQLRALVQVTNKQGCAFPSALTYVAPTRALDEPRSARIGPAADWVTER